MPFRIRGLAPEPFAALHALPDDRLAACRARRMVVDRPHAFPCRISLTDATPGQTVILTHFEHHAVDSPFRASHAIYVRADEQRYDAIDAVPDMLRRRLLSVRGFDVYGMLCDAAVVEGTRLEEAIRRMFSIDAVTYLHLHIAAPGCFAARVERA